MPPNSAAARIRAWEQEEASIAARNWNGYIPANGIDGWDIQVLPVDHPGCEPAPRLQFVDVLQQGHGRGAALPVSG